MRFINCTPHEITIRDEEANNLAIVPSGHVPRVIMKYMPVTTHKIGETTVEVKKAFPVDVEGLPDPEKDVGYIVSAMVAQALPSRSDLFAPDTGPDAFRNERGHIIAVRRLLQYQEPEFDEIFLAEDSPS